MPHSPTGCRSGAVTLRLLGNRRDSPFTQASSQRQSQSTIGIFNTVLGQDLLAGTDGR